jgi:adenosine deaminase
LLIETDRSFSEEQTQILFEKAVKFKHMGIVGVDMSGHIPDNFKIDTYVKPFKYAKDNGLKITFHSGEIPGTEYEMGEMIEKISPNRIGHGIQATKNKEILDLVKKRDIHLEICPTSNLRTGCVKDLSEFGTMIKILKDNQISFSINTDGFAFFKTSITKEYELLLSNGILESKDVAYYTNEAKERSFINN